MSSVGREFRHIAGLAVPVIIAELGWIFMGVVDTIMVGPLGPSAIGAVSVASILFETAGICGIGLILGLDTLISQAWGAGRLRQCDHWLWQGMWLCLFSTPLLMLIMRAMPAFMELAGVHGGVLYWAEPYLLALTWSLPPLLIYAVFRRYLQGMSVVRPIMFTLISANVVNWAGNSVLIPRFGVEGAAWATVVSRVYMAVVLVAVALLRERSVFRAIPRPEWTDIREILRLGLPAAGQILLEIGVFATATLLAGRLQPESLAAHQVALNIAGTTFMVPLGVSSAGAVAVGQAIGRNDLDGARRAGWIAIAIGCGFMVCGALVMFAAPRALVGLFTRNTGVMEIAVPLLFVAAIFQLFDGLQVTTTGVLRGAGNTRTPMLANLIGHWLFGLPAGYVLCFFLGWGVVGLWVGLSTGLIAVGLVLLVVWSRQTLRGHRYDGRAV